MKKGKLYGVGVGPGDEELITQKALRILRECDVIAVPLMKNGERTAFNIVENYIKDKFIINCEMPMNKDFKHLSENYGKISDIIETELKTGKNVAFITLGCPTVYSTYTQINSIILNRGYETEIIPGITSFSAAAAKLNVPLCERNEPLIVLPASYNEIKSFLHIKGTKVLMKANKEIQKTLETLKKENLLDTSYMAERCGMKNERIFKDLNKVSENMSYFSTIIVKEKS